MPHIIGTAGHIDHGKTALVRALTGQDTDRLKEEKERGISIDLGFAYFDLSNGERAGIVDVPGHERFIRNMLAGAHGIDLVLLVVAADDGVMPQTEEHLDIVHLLGVSQAVVAITKADLVDAARLLVVREEIEILLASTRLEGAPVVAVSSIRGDGLAELRQAIEAQLARGVSRPPTGYFRLPVDRAFVMRGHGTVVTGTATNGQVQHGDVVRILPSGSEARVRRVQVHGDEVATATCGQRVALNLAGIERIEVGRGQVICDARLDRVTTRLDAWVEVRPSARRRLVSHQSVRLHVGTAEVMGRIILLDGRKEWQPKQSGFCQLVLREPVHVLRGDRFVLRDPSAQGTIGGGIVGNPFALPHKGGETALIESLRILCGIAGPSDVDSSAAAVVGALLDLSPVIAADIAALAQAGALLPEEVVEAIVGTSTLHGIPVGPHPEACMTAENWLRLQSSAVQTLTAFHLQEPRLPGMEMESLRSQVAVDLSAKLFRHLVDVLVAEKLVLRDDSIVHLPIHRVGLRQDEYESAGRIEALLIEAAFTPPDSKEIALQLSLPGAKLVAILQEMEREARVARVAEGMYFATAILEKARDLIRDHCARHGEIRAAEFRDLLGASRKYSIALLDYFDRTGFTLRVGDVRKLRR